MSVVRNARLYEHRAEGSGAGTAGAARFRGRSRPAALCSPSPPTNPPREDRQDEITDAWEPELNSHFSFTFSNTRGLKEGRRHLHVTGSGRDDKWVSWKDIRESRSLLPVPRGCRLWQDGPRSREWDSN